MQRGKRRHYSITSSTRASMVGGADVLAVLRLIHGLYRACTGSSDGFRL
jgi:hypothetical protein